MAGVLLHKITSSIFESSDAYNNTLRTKLIRELPDRFGAFKRWRFDENFVRARVENPVCVVEQADTIGDTKWGIDHFRDSGDIIDVNRAIVANGYDVVES